MVTDLQNIFASVPRQAHDQPVRMRVAKYLHRRCTGVRNKTVKTLEVRMHLAADVVFIKRFLILDLAFVLLENLVSELQPFPEEGVVSQETHRQHQQRQGYGDDAPSCAKSQRPFDQSVGQPRQKYCAADRADSYTKCRSLSLDDLQKGQQGPVPEIERVADQSEPDQYSCTQDVSVDPGRRPGRDQ